MMTVAPAEQILGASLPIMYTSSIFKTFLGDGQCHTRVFPVLQAQSPDPLRLSPVLKSVPPAKQAFSLTAEAAMPADMIPAYLPQRERLAEQPREHSIPAGGTCSPCGCSPRALMP